MLNVDITKTEYGFEIKMSKESQNFLKQQGKESLMGLLIGLLDYKVQIEHNLVDSGPVCKAEDIAILLLKLKAVVERLCEREKQ